MLPPVARQEGAVEVRLVGEPPAVSDIVEALPPRVEVDVHEVGGGGLPNHPTDVPLTERQREAVRAALELGYYDRPREATHEDVGAVIDCAASTATEHLQKAEAKFVRAAMTNR